MMETLRIDEELWVMNSETNSDSPKILLTYTVMFLGRFSDY